MIGVAVAMLRGRGTPGNPAATCTIENAPKTVGFGVLTGLLSGFFGICGGLLIVPGLIAATGMPILMAIGSSLVAVTAFGTTTALNFALSGYVDWVLGAVFVTGGFAGMLVGARLSKTLSAHMGLLNTLFAGMIFFRGALHGLSVRDEPSRPRLTRYPAANIARSRLRLAGPNRNEALGDEFDTLVV